MKQLSKEQAVQEKQYCFPYHYLDLYSGVYREIILRHYLSLLRTNVKMLKPFIGQKILDAGCGDGRFCYELGNENVELTGIDYSDRAIAFARAFNPSGTFLVGDVTTLNYKNHYDIATLIMVLEHIPPDEISNCVISLHKLIKPGGKLLVSVPSVNLPLQEKHFQHFSPETLLIHFREGFDLIEKRGHTQSGKEWKRYDSMRKRAQILWPLRRKIPLIKKYTDHVVDYYKSIEDCDINQAISITLLLEKVRK